MIRRNPLTVVESYPALKDEGEVNLKIMDILRELFIIGDAYSLRRLQRFNALMIQIFSSPATSAIFFYLLENGACSAFTLTETLKVPEGTVYRCLKCLRELGLLEPAIKAEKTPYSRGGPRTTIWALIGSTTSQVKDALNLYYNLQAQALRRSRERGLTNPYP